jgi:hypothetical protein
VQTQFNCSGIADPTMSNVPLVSSITMADGSAYQFAYEPTPSGFNPVSPGAVTGRVVETITDQEDAQAWTFYGFMNAAAAASIKFKAYNPIRLTFVTGASVVDLAAEARANQECTEQIYGH